MKERLPMYLYIFSVFLIVAGLLLGEHKEVFQKAVTICLSCIGIG